MDCRDSKFLGRYFQIALLASLSLFVAAATSRMAAEVALTNEAVIELHQLGIGETVILEKIRTTENAFDVSIAGIKQLKGAGVPDAVIAEMMRAKKDATTPANSAGAPAEPDPNDPLAFHEAGIYVEQEVEGKRALVQLEVNIPTSQRMKGGLGSAFSWGIAKTKLQVTLAGEHAALQISDPHPTFYFYFDRNTSRFGNGMPSFGMGPTSPNEYVLVRPKSKSGVREMTVGAVNAFGASGGVDTDSVRQFDFQKLASGIYKVVPRENLSSGEYCFLWGGSAQAAAVPGSARMYDFGIATSMARK